ncbi:MAG: DUF4097 family beta strand repeat protein [Clostridia bacterium]|nr:DUF4097 family beta strand repeat protein [Clostridia bacterium]
MNGNVTRVVDFLFRDIEESEEVLSIRDEIMNNCQERYDNMIASGYSDEEALGAVAESLKGMDEVLKDYPRKGQYTDEDFSKENINAEKKEGEVCIDWDILRALRINVRSADVEILATEGRQTLELVQGTATYLDAQLEGDTLVITQHLRGDQAQQEESKDTGILGMIARLIGSAIRAIPDGEECRVKIMLPADQLRRAQVQTISGDITFEVSADHIDLQTTSGELNVSVPDKKAFSDEKCFGEGAGAAEDAPEMKARSISGGIDVRGCFSAAALSSTSGDIDFAGSSTELSLKTVSGDIDAETVSPSVNGSSVSGDITLAVKVSSGEIRLDSVSGDIELEIPNAGSGIRAEAGSRSGDVNYYNVSLRDDAPMKVRVKTVSGDVTVQG